MATLPWKGGAADVKFLAERNLVNLTRVPVPPPVRQVMKARRYVSQRDSLHNVHQRKEDPRASLRESLYPLH